MESCSKQVICGPRVRWGRGGGPDLFLGPGWDIASPLLVKAGPGFWDFRTGAAGDLGYEVSASLILATKLSRGLFPASLGVRLELIRIHILQNSLYTCI
jgi:hypothetical protein